MKTIKHSLLAGVLYFLPLSGAYAQTLSGHVDAEAAVKKLVVYLQPQGKAPVGPAQTVAVSQKDTRFNPALTVVTVGDQVQWLNDEDKEIDHNIYSLSEVQHFDLGLGAKGSKLGQTFGQLGELNYYCSVHKAMEGKIVVLPSRHFQILEAPGEFKLDNVPPGKWTLTALVFHRRYKAEPVTLDIGQQPLTNLSLKVVKR